MPQKIIVWLFILALFGFYNKPALAQLNLNQLNNPSPWLERQEGLQGASGVGQVAYGSQNPKDPRLIVIELIQIFLGLLGVTCVVLIIIGGYLWMTAGGSQERVTLGRKFITNAAIGLLIILASFAVTLYLTRRILCATRDLYCSNSFWIDIGNP